MFLPSLCYILFLFLYYFVNCFLLLPITLLFSPPPLHLKYLNIRKNLYSTVGWALLGVFMATLLFQFSPGSSLFVGTHKNKD